jgi:adenosylhomocysteine nucleosidase
MLVSETVIRDSMPTITLYTQPDCHACALVKEWLTARGVAFTEHDIRADAAALAAVRALGALSTPVTVIGETVVIGFNHRKLASLLDRGSSGGDTGER